MKVLWLVEVSAATLPALKLRIAGEILNDFWRTIVKPVILNDPYGFAGLAGVRQIEIVSHTCLLRPGKLRCLLLRTP
jgi:hypothetical protein